MKRGRPSSYKPEYCEMLIKHMAAGASFMTFASLMGCHRDTLYQWNKSYPAFNEAKDIGTSASLAYWEQLGINGTLGEIPGFNARVWILTMRNRFGWGNSQKNRGHVPEAQAASPNCHPLKRSNSNTEAIGWKFEISEEFVQFDPKLLAEQIADVHSQTADVLNRNISEAIIDAELSLKKMLGC